MLCNVSYSGARICPITSSQGTSTASPLTGIPASWNDAPYFPAGIHTTCHPLRSFCKLIIYLSLIYPKIKIPSMDRNGKSKTLQSASKYGPETAETVTLDCDARLISRAIGNLVQNSILFIYLQNFSCNPSRILSHSQNALDKFPLFHTLRDSFSEPYRRPTHSPPVFWD